MSGDQGKQKTYSSVAIHFLFFKAREAELARPPCLPLLRGVWIPEVGAPEFSVRFSALGAIVAPS